MTMENKFVPKPGDTKAPAFDIDANIDKLSDSQKYFYKKFKRVNRERWEVNQIYRRSGRRVGLGLGFFALGIYFYTMYAVKQEKFLDEDFNTLPDNVKES